MKSLKLIVGAATIAVLTTPATARDRSQARTELAPYLQCAPYARQISGVEIYGDAATWWGQAQGRYRTGKAPSVGAVMAFQPHRSMRLGHVATVSRVLDSRRVLLDHANWSPINGRRGQVEKDVLAVDVSPNNDWSAVRVWYAPIGDVGKTVWPVAGFIYSDKATGKRPVQIARAAPVQPPVRKETSKAFQAAFANFTN